MPQAIAAVAAKIAFSAFTAFNLAPAGAALAGIYYGAQAALYAALAFGGAALSRALTPDIDTGAGSQTVSENSPVTSRKLRFGEFEAAGSIVYHTSVNNDEILNICEVYAPHECQEVIGFHYNDKWLFPAMIDANGYVTEGKYWSSNNRPNHRVEYELGSRTTASNWPEQFAGPYAYTHEEEMAIIPDEWNDKALIHGNGAFKVWYRWKMQPNLYPNGVPKRSVFARWNNQITDTRDSTVKYTNNPALILKYYCELSAEEGGAGFPSGVLTDANITAEANVCDEEVSLSTVWSGSDSIDVGLAVPADDTIVLSKGAQPRLLLQTGDGVEFTTGTTLPGGLSASPTRYYAIVVRHEAAFEGSEDNTWLIKVATSYANALAGTAVDITTAGTGDHTLAVVSHPRYTFNGQLDPAAPVRENIKLILNSMGGHLYPIAGQAVLKAGAYRAPTLTFDEGDLTGDLQITQTRHPTEQRFNAVRGKYVDQQFYGQLVVYDPITSAAYETNDNNSGTIYRDMDFPCVSKMDQARRLASIHLERHRYGEKVVVFPFKPVAHQLIPGDTFYMNFDAMNWTNELFEVIDFELKLDDKDGQLVGVDVVGVSTSSSVYDAPGTVTPAFPTSGGPSTDKTPPSGLLVTEDLVEFKNAQIIRALLNWTAPSSGYVDHYDIQYKASTDTWDTINAIVIPDTQNEYAVITDVAPGIYDWRIRAVDSVDRKSAWVEVQQEIYGYNDPPADVANLSLGPFHSNVFAVFDASTEADVIGGGYLMVRWSPDSTTWTNSVSVGAAKGQYPGTSVFVALPKREGYFLFKWKDASGQLSANATTGYVTLDDTGYTSVATVTEHTTFSGTKDDCSVAASVLSMDTVGGTSVEPDATYTFANSMNLGSVTKVRVTTHVKATVNLEYGNIDSRTGTVDDWEDWDGAGAGEADARVWMRWTEDDPTGSPTWTSWTLTDVAIIDAWGIEFKLEMRSYDDQTNIDVSELSAVAATLP